MLLVVPLAIPDFVVSFGWSSIITWVAGFRGAVLVMTLAVYPLVYLPVAASFRSADPGQEEIARSLGLGRLETFCRVTLRQARGAILGGCLLVALVLLAEYGAFEILGYQTFTTEIFTEFSVSLRRARRLRRCRSCSWRSACSCWAGTPPRSAAAVLARSRRAGAAGRPRYRLGRARAPALASVLVLCRPGARRSGRIGDLLARAGDALPISPASRCSMQPGTPRCTAAAPPRSRR